MGTQLVGYGELMGEIDPDLVGYDAEIGISSDQVGAARGAGKTQANRRYPVGLGSVSVPAGGSAILRGAPTLKFRADRLMLVPAAPGLLVTQVMAGNVSQTMGSNGSPAEAFGPASFGAAMTGQTIDPAVEIFVNLSNPTGAAIVCAGTVFGLADQ